MALALRTTDELKRDLTRLRTEQREMPVHSPRWHVLGEAIDRTLDELQAARRR